MADGRGTAWAPSRQVTLRTARLEQVRALPYGFLQSCATAYFLLIAVKQFDAGPLAKSSIAAATSIGHLLSPALVAATRRLGVVAMSAAAAVMVAGAAALAVVLVSGGVGAYVAGTMVALACVETMNPLLTTVYQRNYGAHERGRWVARAGIIRVAFTAAIGPLVGDLLRRDIGRYKLVVGAAVVSFGLCALLLRLVPSSELPATDAGVRADGTRRRGTSFLPDFGLLATDRILRSTLISWMFMGFGNLMMIPMRVEYLANPRYGLAADAGLVAMLTVTVPAVVRLVSMPVFGWMFDRLSFFAIRIALNGIFALAIVTFFTGTSTTGLYLGAVFYGVAMAGGDIMWSLWVIKFAPADKVADYMGLHTFTTGIRGVLAPFAAFQIVQSLSVGTVGLLSAALIAVASLILVPEVRTELAARRQLKLATAPR